MGLQNIQKFVSIYECKFCNDVSEGCSLYDLSNKTWIHQQMSADFSFPIRAISSRHDTNLFRHAFIIALVVTRFYQYKLSRGILLLFKYDIVVKY